MSGYPLCKGAGVQVSLQTPRTSGNTRIERFRREAIIAGGSSPPSVACVSYPHGRTTMAVMLYVTGKSLDHRLRVGRCTTGITAFYSDRPADALAYIP